VTVKVSVVPLPLLLSPVVALPPPVLPDTLALPEPAFCKVVVLIQLLLLLTLELAEKFNELITFNDLLPVLSIEAPPVLVSVLPCTPPQALALDTVRVNLVLLVLEASPVVASPPFVFLVLLASPVPEPWLVTVLTPVLLLLTLLQSATLLLLTTLTEPLPVLVILAANAMLQLNATVATIAPLDSNSFFIPPPYFMGPRAAPLLMLRKHNITCLCFSQ
jgi:hypothetical protein